MKTTRTIVLVVFLTQQSSKIGFSIKATMARTAITEHGMNMSPQQAYDAKMANESKGDNDDEKEGEIDIKEKSTTDEREISHDDNLQKNDEPNIQKCDNDNEKEENKYETTKDNDDKNGKGDNDDEEKLNNDKKQSGHDNKITYSEKVIDDGSECDNEKKSNKAEESEMNEDDEDIDDDEDSLNKVHAFETPQRVLTKKLIENLTLICLSDDAVKMRKKMRK